MSVVREQSGKIGFVAMVCGLALAAPSVAFAAGPEYSPLPQSRSGPDVRPDAVISQSVQDCDGSALWCWFRQGERQPANRSFGRGDSDIDGGGDDRGGRSSR